jgi:hypothetical protein
MGAMEVGSGVGLNEGAVNGGSGESLATAACAACVGMTVAKAAIKTTR